MMRSLLRGKAKMILVLGVAFLVAALAAGCSKPAPEAQKPAEQKPAEQKPAEQPKEPYKIGALLSVTGGASSLGIPEKNTIDMVLEEINAKGGINGHKVELKFYDIETDETKAVLAFKKLVEEDKVAAVIGPETSGPSLALVDSANKMEVPLVSHAASVKIVEPVAERKWVFKTAQSDVVVIQKAIEYMKSKGYKRIAWLNQNDAYGESGRVGFEKAAPGAGLQIVAQEKFNRQDTDMTAQLTKVKGLNPDAVLIWAIPPSASVVTKNYRDLGIKAPLIHSHGIGNANFLELAGDAANGVVLPIGRLLVAEQLPDNDPQKPVVVKYAKDYEARYGPRSTFGGHGWDGLMIVLKALENVGPDRAKIRDYIENLKGFPGVSGVFNMSPQDHNGLGVDSLVMATVVDGKWKLLEQ